ncbi:MAG: 1-deoxy-D-xylulose-5-phosphate reductoisomerase [Zoogloeaceae bacterium]|jgi:1-deoxy-D-xylulose-5-phosphate reductoisomerase|nr:1-deoxy-D-xylulose-5-phosphate reductoisomerase [Zoogloeaceae bacterium]
MSNLHTLTLLGSTGSIGESTLAVVALHPERYRVFALTAHRQWEKLLAQCARFRPQVAVVGEAEAAASLQAALHAEGLTTEVLYGDAALCRVAAAPEADTVMAAIVGAAGLPPALAAAEAGKRLLLANKEALVMAGALFMETVARHGATLLPVDSEHNAIFQALPAAFAAQPQAGVARHGVKKLWLTASGGSFRRFSADELEAVKPEQAVSHPNWVMGRKISVDSASLMNKGLEVIEARWLFNAPPEMIGVVVHPQSVIHSLVEYVDGSQLAQLGTPDMRVPIAHALFWPERQPSGVKPLSLFEVARLDFEVPDTRRFPCLQLAFDALAAGGAASAVLNAANEVAVAAFLEGRLSFPGIARVNAETLAALPQRRADSLEAIWAADAEARRKAAHLIETS